MTPSLLGLVAPVPAAPASASAAQPVPFVDDLEGALAALAAAGPDGAPAHPERSTVRCGVEGAAVDLEGLALGGALTKKDGDVPPARLRGKPGTAQRPDQGPAAGPSTPPRSGASLGVNGGGQAPSRLEPAPSPAPERRPDATASVRQKPSEDDALPAAPRRARASSQRGARSPESPDASAALPLPGASAPPRAASPTVPGPARAAPPSAPPPAPASPGMPPLAPAVTRGMASRAAGPARPEDVPAAQPSTASAPSLPLATAAPAEARPLPFETLLAAAPPGAPLVPPASLLPAAALEDPSLRVYLGPAGARLRVEVDGAELALHLRVHEGVAHVRMEGEALAALPTRAAEELRQSLATAGLSLGALELGTPGGGTGAGADRGQREAPLPREEVWVGSRRASSLTATPSSGAGTAPERSDGSRHVHVEA